ncbi:GNAT family N-acetyltransferase [Sulfitobacter sp. SH24]|uniref:GNAT family N-acetyltransferase n=1 Tax=Sulfitobacter sp. SH24 TaxID=3421173 RepID=UPI003F4FE92C
MQAITPQPVSLSLPALRRTLLRHYRRLSEASRRLRFMGGIKEEVLTQTANSASPNVMFGIEENGAYRGILELHIPEDGRAEIGLSVEDAYQGRGFGRALFQRGLSEARARQVQSVDVHFSNANAAIRKLCLEMGGDMRVNGTDSLSRITL